MKLVDICAILAAGATVGSVGTVAVQKTATPNKKVERVVKKMAPTSKTTIKRSAKPSQSLLSDCPLPTIGGALSPLDEASIYYSDVYNGGYEYANWIRGGADFPLNGAGGGDVGRVPAFPVTPGVPETDTWVMLISGFGLVGLAARKRKVKKCC